MSSACGIHEIFGPDEIKIVANKAFGPDAKVSDYEIKSFSEDKLGFLGNHKSLEITCQFSDSVFKSKKFFIKGIPTEGLAEQVEFVKNSGVFDQESEYFNKLLPELEKSCECERFSPRSYFGNNEGIVLEDLRTRGYDVRKDKLFDCESLEAAVRAQARLHAASLLAEERLGKSLGELFPHATTERIFTKLAMEHKLDTLVDDLASQVAKREGRPHKRFSAAFWWVYNYVNDPNVKNRVVSHGDFWPNNIMFDNSTPPRCILVDYQLCRYAPRTFDLAGLMYLSTDRKTREAHEKTALKAYHQELCSTIKKNNPSLSVPTLDDIVGEYEETRICGQLLAVFYYPIILLSQEMINKFAHNPVYYARFMFRQNNDCILEEMEKDKYYKRRITEAVLELSEACEKLKLKESEDL